MPNFRTVAAVTSGGQPVYIPMIASPLRLDITPFSPAYQNPTSISHAGDDRLFITEQAGVIHVLSSDGTPNPQPFLNITDRVDFFYPEEGLLGLTFHPNYAQNGYFYVNYTQMDGETRFTRISRFTVTANPEIADPNSEVLIMKFVQPHINHNGGHIAFGPDGYLYIGVGDGGNHSDLENYGQSTNTLLGKMLRIDVDMESGLEVYCDFGGHYTIPADNPFVNVEGTCHEIWMIGLRNPWRYSFDAETGDMFIADVGQWTWEEINYHAAGTPAGVNLGWNCLEGFTIFNGANCGNLDGYHYPIHAYEHGSGSPCEGAVVGGYVYRGNDYPNLDGHYIFADFCTGEIWSLLQTNDGWQHRTLYQGNNFFPVAFGQGVDNELYVVDYVSGVVHYLRPPGAMAP
ncbi:MAG TPA: PQQ-dependent sugar dehydrogenase [Anaerolineae bacterium]|nr:PQQ-dependent sugar dehydrogenase [Anaerolineae bacterium]